MSIVTPGTPQGPSSRRTPTIPFLVLIGVVMAVGVLFYQVIRPLIVPLFLAAVIALLAYPLHVRLLVWTRGRSSLAAGLVTLLIVLVIIGPLSTAVYLAVLELREFLDQIRDGSELKDVVANQIDPRLSAILERLPPSLRLEPDAIHAWILKLGSESGQVLYERSLDTLSSLPRVVLGTAMFLIALFFFVRDGMKMVAGWEQLTPMDMDHDRLIRTEFVRVCRGVVLGTVAAALVQAALFGVALFVIDIISDAGIGRWTFLLSLLTAAVSMIPFLGAAAVWVPTALVLLLNGHPVAALILAIHGLLVVSTADNVVKVVVIGERANLHPLLVFVSVFGGIQLVGFLGIFIGPIVAAVLVALLRILRREIITRNRTLGERPGLADLRSES